MASVVVPADKAEAAAAHLSTADPARVAAVLRQSGTVEIDLPGTVHLGGDWSLPEGSITIRARGGVIADDWRLVSPGSRLTLDAPAIHLRGCTLLDVSRTGGRGGSVTLAGGRTRGIVEIGAAASIDASGSAGQGGSIRLAAADVQARGSLLAAGRGLIEVEARGGLEFLSRADTGGGLIRLDPTNMRIGNFGGTDSNVTAGVVRSPNSPPANGQLDAGNLALLLTTSSVIVHTTSAAGPGIGLQTAIAGDALDGDIAVEAPVVWSSAFNLTLLAHDDLIVLAPVQNGSTGSVVGVSGWDGSTMSGFTGNSVPSSAYGASGGDTFVVGTSGPDVNVAFGGRDGTTALWADDVVVRGSTHATQTFDGFAMVGFRMTDGTSAGGPIHVTAQHDISLLPGKTSPDSLRFAQIGHGGELWMPRTGTLQGNLSGAITVDAGGTLLMDDGNFTSYAQIGHGGLELDSVTRGNLSGDMSVSALVMTLTGNDSGGVQIGHGGTVDKITTQGDIDGAITIDAGSLTLTTGVTLAGGARIGHGGSAVTALNPPAARIAPVVGDIGSNVAGGAPILVTVTNDVTLNHILTAGRSGISQIGHGGPIVFGGTFGTIAGDITLTAGGSVTLTSGGNCNNFCGSQIGHSAAQLTIFNSSVGAVRGDVVVSAGGTVSLSGGGTSIGGGQLQYAQIGHGGPLAGAQDVFSIAGTTSWAGTPAVSGNTNDVTVNAPGVIVQGGMGALAYAQIGSGGLVASNDNTFSHVVQGPLDGRVSVTATTGDLTVAAGPDSNGLASGHIGNGGWNGSNAGVTTVTESGASGAVSIVTADETSLVDAAGGSKWWLGHRTEGALTSAPVLVDTGTLDFVAGPGATNATISDPAFWTRFVADPAPGPEKANATGGVVTFRVHGPAGNDGNLISGQPLIIPAVVANAVRVLSTDDLTFNSPVTNNGSSVVDLVADDANPNPPNLSLTALLTIGPGGTPVGAVRLFAVGPGQFFKPVTYTPAEKYGVWYETFGAPVAGVNFKVNADPTLSTQASGMITVGGSVSDDATLAGGSAPTGTITFSLYGPNDATCSGAAAFTANIPVSGNGVYSSGPFTPATAGIYRWVASYGGDAGNNAAVSPCNAVNESVVVSQATPALTTQASAPVTLGNSISDDGTLSGGASPTGSVTFNLYGPDDATCSGAIAFTGNVPVSGNGTYSSGPFTPTQLGTYRWVAIYGGDTNNATITSPCNAPNESVVVSQATPTLTTQASAAVTIGGSVSDDGTLSGGASPTGSITFELYGPNDATCSGSIVFTSIIPVAGNGLYGSGSFVPPLPSLYRWVASYSGDANNAATASPCNAPNESVAVGLGIPTLTTQASAPVTLGAAISDSATLAGGSNPTGSIIFDAYGPNDAACSGAIAFTATVPVAGNGVYASGPFTPALAGTYRWVASYSGDAGNTAVASPCNAPNESVTVNPITPTLTTQASAPIPLGGNISDAATLSGGANPTGSIVFNLYGPDDLVCSGAIAFTATVPVAGNGVYASGSFAPAVAGMYRWVASYSGDANNTAVTSPCNAPNESVVVNPVTPELTTQASAPVTLGGTISDAATLSGGANPTGSIVFNLYGPDDATCGGTVAFTSSIPVAGNGVYTSGSFTPALAGTYRWVAGYSGDASNTAATSPCNAPNESVGVGLVIPTLTTQASAPILLGGSISDAGNLSGGSSPTGSITFDLYGPNDAACSGLIAFTATTPVTGNGVYSSGSFTPALAGTYRWVAGYSGDGNHAPVTSPCNAPNESVVVSPVGASLSGTKTVSPGPYPVGGTIVYTIILTNSGNGTQADNAGDELTDVLPPALALISANATSGTAVASTGTNAVAWNGLIPPAGTVTITITATILPATAGTTISNQGTMRFDGDGNLSNESTAQTDDPAVGGSADATAITVSDSVSDVPTLSPTALLLFCALMVAIAIVRFTRLS